MSAPTKVPRASGLPVLGSLLEFRSRRTEMLLRVQRECGDVGLVRLGPLEVVVLSSPELAHQVLVGQAEDFNHMPLAGMYGMRRLIGQSMLVTEGEKHLAQRRRTIPVFKPRRVESYVGMIAPMADAWRRRWKHGARIDLYDELVKLSLQVLQRVLFGVQSPSESSELGRALSACVECAMEEMTSFLQVPLVVPTPRNRRFARGIELLEHAVAAIVAGRRAATELGDDFLGALLAARDEQGRPLAHKDIRDDLVTVFIAGYEAMASVLVWSLYELSRNGSARERLENQVDAALGDKLPTASDFDDMPFVLAVLKETMRLYPPNHIMFRRAERDIEIGGHYFPAGTLVAINGYAIQRRADLFSEPNRFIPERFIGADDRTFGKAYFPFGAGPRWCIGAHYAIAVGQTVLSVFSRHHRFELLGDPETHAEFALVPRGGLPVLVLDRATRTGNQSPAGGGSESSSS